MSARSLLIRDAELLGGVRADVRIFEKRIAEIGALEVASDERTIEAQGGLLIPGLHDHHIHLLSTAAARASVFCGPPQVKDAEALIRTLDRSGGDWLRGVGYHESVAGMLDRRWLDHAAPDRPVRIQHRSGRMWFFNSAGVDRLLASGLALPSGWDGQNGRLFDADAWLRHALEGQFPQLKPVGETLAAFGITGVTDMTPSNGGDEHGYFAREQASGALSQRMILAGTADLAALAYNARLGLGPVKVHLHEAELPPYDHLITTIGAAHERGRGIAVHCVTEVELLFALAALREAGTSLLDRIEHAAVTTDSLLAEIAALDLSVAVQPFFVFERGDAYRRDIDPDDWSCLYRLHSFHEAGVPLAGSSDAPYVDLDPWAAMRAAVSRRTNDGVLLGATEALSPEQALALYLANPMDFRKQRAVSVGEVADLCLLDSPWHVVRETLRSDHVAFTFVTGMPIFERSA